MGLTPEQVSRDIFPVPAGNLKKAAKRSLARKQRRQARKDPENALRKKRYAGWYW